MRKAANQVFYKSINEGQRNFIHTIYSWTVETNIDPRLHGHIGSPNDLVVELTVLDERQATLAQLFF